MAKPTGEITLAAQPVKVGAQWHVVGTYPGGQQEHITGFETEAAALDWDRKRFGRLARKTTSSLNSRPRTDDEAANRAGQNRKPRDRAGRRGSLVQRHHESGGS